MIVYLLVCLSKSMMICLARRLVSEASEVRLVSLLLLHFNGNAFNLQN